jgi:hypothetical protein
VNATANRLFVLVALGLLSSCSPPDIDISVENTDQGIQLKLSQDWGLIFSDNQAPCVREIGLYEPTTYERNRAAWLIETKGDVQCLDLTFLRVGDIPAGWQQVVPLSSIRGRTYAVRVNGIGMGEASITF